MRPTQEKKKVGGRAGRRRDRPSEGGRSPDSFELLPSPRPLRTMRRREHKKIDLIIDTDMSIDVDDVGALCVAHALVSWAWRIPHQERNT